MIAAQASHQGKTTVTLGLLRALHNRGLHVQSFKCGPDYLDTYHHGLASGTTGINLDLFMSSTDHVQQLYGKYAANADVAVTEGVMGLFDGSVEDHGSAASLAKSLQIPVVMVMNASAMAWSAAAILYGFKNFDPEVQLAGVIFNQVKTTSHYRILQDAAKRVGVEALGYIPPSDAIQLPSRYLGLNIDPDIDFTHIIEKIANHVQNHIDLDKLLAITSVDFSHPQQNKSFNISETGSLKIAVAHDEAFNFFYQENFETLARLGKITYFSPLHDKTLPETDLLYLAGGYPELYLPTLSQNQSMLSSIKIYCEKGGCALAECGGLMYLGEQITDSAGNEFPMVDFFPVSTSMVDKQMTLGYRSFELDEFIIKGHEFHYSRLEEKGKIEGFGRLTNARGEPVKSKVYRKKQVTGSYVHFYWPENPYFLEQLIKRKNHEHPKT